MGSDGGAGAAGFSAIVIESRPRAAAFMRVRPNTRTTAASSCAQRSSVNVSRSCMRVSRSSYGWISSSTFCAVRPRPSMPARENRTRSWLAFS